MNEKVDEEELKEILKRNEGNLTKCGKEIGLSDKGFTKRLKKVGLPYYKKDIIEWLKNN